jgi:hypothetical protein
MSIEIDRGSEAGQAITLKVACILTGKPVGRNPERELPAKAGGSSRRVEPKGRCLRPLVKKGPKTPGIRSRRPISDPRYECAVYRPTTNSFNFVNPLREATCISALLARDLSIAPLTRKR